MTPEDVGRTLNVLLAAYADREGQKPKLNDVQRAVWADALAPFPPAAVEAASKAWMHRSAFMPRPSDLLSILRPIADPQLEAQLAWSTVERAVTQAGRYRGVTFADGAIGEAVRQTFGSWGRACAFDYDSPGWAIRRQTFLAIYPGIAARQAGGPVTLRGDHSRETPYLVGHVDGLTLPPGSSESHDRPLTHGESRDALSRLQLALEARKLVSTQGQ